MQARLTATLLPSKFFVLIALCAFGALAHAQLAHTLQQPYAPVQKGNATATALEFNKVGTIYPRELNADWNVSLVNLEMPAPGSNSYRAFLQEHKAEIASRFEPNADAKAHEYALRTASELPQPEVLSGFEGNPYNSSVPNDNDLAINEDGIIISVINSNMRFYDTAGVELFNSSLGNFVDTLGISAGKFDPRVLYDPDADRFILAFLGGFDSSNTHIFVCFSGSSDPMDPWNLYSLPGNPKANGTWSDYPMIGMTNDELFLSINLLLQGEPWQTGFTETLVWQMDKSSGYTGGTLGVTMWDGIELGGRPLRNLCPMQGGSALTGPNMYLLSNRNFDESNDTIFMVEITGTMSDPGTVLNTSFALADVPYGVPPVARQPSGHTFDTNDGRILDGFIENGYIQFVSNSMSPANGLSGIYHGVISDLGGSPSVNGAIITDFTADSMDFGYPEITYTGQGALDDQAVITFEMSSPYVFPGISCVYFNYNDYSDVLRIYEGETFVNILSGTYERWGDYTGAQLVYSEPGTLWISGNFGKLSGNIFSPRQNATWIAKLSATEVVTVGVDETPAPVRNQNVYPNPATGPLTVEFDLPESTFLSFELFDIQGKLVRTLLYDKAKSGTNRFSFDLAPLQPGTYLLRIADNKKVLLSREIIKH